MSIQNNFLTSTGWSISLENEKYPNLNCNILKFDHPSIEVKKAKQPSPRISIPVPGAGYNFEPLKMTAIISSDMTAYNTFYDWLVNEVETKDNPIRDKTIDVKLFLYNAKANLSKTITFVGAFPTNLSGFKLDTTDKADNYLTFDITMEYTYFKID